MNSKSYYCLGTCFAFKPTGLKLCLSPLLLSLSLFRFFLLEGKNLFRRSLFVAGRHVIFFVKVLGAILSRLDRILQCRLSHLQFLLRATRSRPAQERDRGESLQRTDAHKCAQWCLAAPGYLRLIVRFIAVRHHAAYQIGPSSSIHLSASSHRGGPPLVFLKRE